LTNKKYIIQYNLQVILYFLVMDEIKHIIHLVHIWFDDSKKSGRDVLELTKRIQTRIQSIADDPRFWVNFVDEYCRYYPEDKELTPWQIMMKHLWEDDAKELDYCIWTGNWKNLIRRPAIEEYRREELFEYAVKLLWKDRIIESFMNSTDLDLITNDDGFYTSMHYKTCSNKSNHFNFLKQFYSEQVGRFWKQATFLRLVKSIFWKRIEHTIGWEYFGKCTVMWIFFLLGFWVKLKDVWLDPSISLLAKDYRELPRIFYHKDCVE
jgi:hypothetical protein